MDQMTPSHDFEPREHWPAEGKRSSRRILNAALVLLALGDRKSVV